MADLDGALEKHRVMFEVQWVKAHLSLSKASELGYSEEQWKGNNTADTWAKDAVSHHLLTFEDIQLYKNQKLRIYAHLKHVTSVIADAIANDVHSKT